MAVSISLVLLTGVIVVVLWRSGYLRFWPTTAVALFGFSLASTGIAPAIRDAITSVTGWISSISF
ncbi:hypothetical protein [Streptomyces aureoverticillatus]|uniref:hypothetical protein n=1 Tax=Streptomyces aureoverticillatus TaxID=66871 RepID=UPI0013DA8A63|nr:hypothetical protein [Streptomyces aureoverticillatus]QIB49502.1 hypothetical protein G3H79_40745 [Streptomyces aureoverticillatus]